MEMIYSTVIVIQKKDQFSYFIKIETMQNRKLLVGQKSSPLLSPIKYKSMIKDNKEIEDLIVISKVENSNIQLLLETAFIRGFIKGKDFAKGKIIEAIEKEK